LDNFFVIQPAYKWWSGTNWSEGKTLPEGFRYASNTNEALLTVNEIRAMAGLQAPPLTTEDERNCDGVPVSA
jgi:hypothetical protein